MGGGGRRRSWPAPYGETAVRYLGSNPSLVRRRPHAKSGDSGRRAAGPGGCRFHSKLAAHGQLQRTPQASGENQALAAEAQPGKQ